MPKRKPKTEDEAVGSIWDHFGLETPDKPGKTAKTDKEPTVAELTAKISDLSGRLDASERANIALMSQPMHTDDGNAPLAPAQPDFKGLPDPISDTENYGKALTERIVGAISSSQQAQSQAQQQQQQRNQRAQALWEDFQIAYPDLSEHYDRVEYAGSKVINDAIARGIDPNRYMYGHKDKFMADVAAKVKNVFGTAKADTDDDTDEPDETDETDVDRSAGVFGGLEAGGAPAPSARERPGDMIADLHALQKRDGFL